MTSDEFQTLVKDECKKSGVKIIVSPEDCVTWVEHGVEVKCNGFFDDGKESDTQPELAWSTGRPFEQWFPVLIHEYNHMRQWLEEDPVWAESARVPDWFEWLDGAMELDEAEIIESCMAYALMELNCDARAVEMIRKFEIDLDPEYYAQTAHAYAWFYFWALENRSWYVIDHEPYRTQAIVEAMPTVMPDPDKDEFSYGIYRRHYKSIFDRHMIAADQNTLFTE